MTTETSSQLRCNDVHESAKENVPGNLREGSETKFQSKADVRHVEVVLHPLCSTARDEIREDWRAYLENNDFILTNNDYVDMSCVSEALQKSCLSARIVAEDDDSHSPMTASSALERAAISYQIYPYTLNHENAAVEELEPTDGGDEWTAACENLSIPHKSLEDSWESLILDQGIKEKLLSYAQSALLFSDKRVSSHIVSWNRLLLLHGPAGTGKTSLCRALANKLSIRLSGRFPSGASLLEIQSHSLFSKWFSTSGKLVTRLFDLVREMVEDDPGCLVFVLVDEVESLAGSRASLGSSSGEPSDAMRAVNALLTSLDRLRSFPNVLVLATTNLTASVDLAFVDRADLKQYIGLPNVKARYEIFRSCVQELIRVGIIRTELSENAILCPFDEVGKSHSEWSRSLLKCADKADGLSGRSLRRLPLQSHAQFIRTPETSTEEFLEALERGIGAEQVARAELQNDIVTVSS